jgi:uncharacterized membrane protein YdjX (TVP38/TMEM64 family)
VGLSPILPFTVVNYLFGMTPVRPGAYIFGSWLAILPGTAAYVYFGSALGNAASGASPVQKAIKLALGVAAVVATALIARFAAKAIRAAGVDSMNEATAGESVAAGSAPHDVPADAPTA